MSAFIVNKSHIDAMVNLGLSPQTRAKIYGSITWDYKNQHRELTAENASQIGQMLVDECVRSVSSRYEDDKLTELPGSVNAYWVLPYQHRHQYRLPTPIEAIKLIQCYKYQSCEHPEWEDSEAHTFCEALKSAMVDCLPGYDEAPWEWEEELVTT